MVFAIVRVNSARVQSIETIAQAFRRIHAIRPGLKHLRHFSSNFGTEMTPKFSIFLNKSPVSTAGITI